MEMEFDNLAGSIVFSLPIREDFTDQDLRNNEFIVRELMVRALDLLRDDDVTQRTLAERGIQIGRITLTSV